MTDLLIAAVVLAGAVSGWRSGALRQVAGVAAFLVALLVGLWGMDEVGAMLASSLNLSSRAAPLAGFVVLFIGVQIAIAAVVRALEGALDAARIGAVNRAAGAALGALRTALVISAVLVPLKFVGVPSPEARASSVLYEPVSRVMPGAWSVAGEHVPPLAARFRRAVDAARADSVNRAADEPDALPDSMSAYPSR